MTLFRHNPKRDQNEGSIVRWLSRHGIDCEQMSAPGIPDLLCWRDGVYFWVECKMPGEKLTSPQRRFFARARENDLPAYVVRCDDDVAVLDADLRERFGDPELAPKVKSR